MSIAEVLESAVRFFARQSGVYSAFVEKQGPTHVVLRGQGGEEVVIGARVTDAGTIVSGSSYLFDAQIARFLDALPQPVAQAATPASQSVPEPVA